MTNHLNGKHTMTQNATPLTCIFTAKVRSEGGMCHDSISGKNYGRRTVPTNAPSRRFPRKDIAGAKGWRVSENGLVYKHQRRQLTENEDFPKFPIVDFGNDYKGFLLPASDQKGLFLLDEIVCLAFHGWPAVPEFLFPYQRYLRMGRMLWWSHVIHHDGNAWNCAADNLAWVADDELLDHTVRAIMWPDCLVKENWRRGKQRASSGKKRREELDPDYVSSPHVPDWMPINHKGKNIA